MCVYTVSAHEVRNLIRDVVRLRVKRDNATCNDNNKRTLLGINSDNLDDSDRDSVSEDDDN